MASGERAASGNDAQRFRALKGREALCEALRYQTVSSRPLQGADRVFALSRGCALTRLPLATFFQPLRGVERITGQ